MSKKYKPGYLNTSINISQDVDVTHPAAKFVRLSIQLEFLSNGDVRKFTPQSIMKEVLSKVKECNFCCE